MIVALGSDHAGYRIKEEIREYLSGKGYIIIDLGTYSEESADYPDFAHAVSLAVERGEADRGILVCGTGLGVSITANKHAGIRCALCWDHEIARLARSHNDANILALPGRFIPGSRAIDMVEIFLNTAFDGGRHSIRIDKISFAKNE